MFSERDLFAICFACRLLILTNNLIHFTVKGYGHFDLFEYLINLFFFIHD